MVFFPKVEVEIDNFPPEMRKVVAQGLIHTIGSRPAQSSNRRRTLRAIFSEESMEKIEIRNNDNNNNESSINGNNSNNNNSANFSCNNISADSITYETLSFSACDTLVDENEPRKCEEQVKIE